MNNKVLSGKRNIVRHLLFAVLLSIVAIDCSAQIELTSGIDLSYPQLLNSNNTKLSYGQITFGLRFGIAYKPEDIQFFPVFTTAFGRTRLPLKQIGTNVAALNFNYINVMINENYVVHASGNEIYIYGGIGFTHLANKGLLIAGPGGETMCIATHRPCRTSPGCQRPPASPAPLRPSACIRRCSTAAN